MPAPTRAVRLCPRDGGAAGTGCPVAGMTIDGRRLGRIRWRCRRGLLENDIVLTRFLDACGETLSDDDIESLDALLDLSDNALWDLIAGRAEPEPAHAAFVARLRAL